MTRPPALRALSAALVSVGLSGCIQLFPDPPPAPRVYALDAGDVARAERRSPAVAAVAEPTGPRMLMGDRIVWRKDGSLAFMDGAAWPGRAPDLLQGLAAETITRRGQLAAGVRSGAGVRPDMEVRWDIIAFEVVEEGGRLEARLAASINVVQTRSRELLASDIIDIREPLASRTGSAAAAALQRAARRAAVRISDMAAEAAGRTR